MNYKDTTKETLNAHIDKLVDIAKSLDLHKKVTILTGGNAMGKSIIRKILPHCIAQKLEDEGIKANANELVRSTSMQLRTENRPEWGAFSSMGSDPAWSSTSEHTIYLLKSMLKDDEKKQFIVIDELEIGMSDELQVATCKMLNRLLEENKDKFFGVLVITHSKVVVQHLEHSKFVNIEGMTEDEWLNRHYEEIEIEDFEKWSTELFVAIRDRMNENKYERTDSETKPKKRKRN